MSHKCHCNSSEQALLPMSYEIIDIVKHTNLEWNFRVATSIPAKLGQFVEVSLPFIGEAPISVSDCGNGWIDLLIRKVGKVTDAIFNLKIGDKVWLRGSYGNGYPLDDLCNESLIVVAGGTGVAPVKGLLRYFYENPTKISHLTMILGYKNRDCVLYKEEIAAWRTVHNLILTLDEGLSDEHHRIGLVTDHLQTLEIPDVSTTQAIVVGPPIMIKFTVQMLRNRGFKPEQIWVDYERKMACSVGKCGHCRMGDVYVCVDGPVFNYAQAQAFVD